MGLLKNGLIYLTLLIFLGFYLTTFAQTPELKRIIIYARPTPLSLVPEISKKTITERFKYKLELQEDVLPGFKYYGELYHNFLEAEVIKDGHLERRVRYLLIINLEKGKDLKVFIDAGGRFEIGNSGKIKKMNEADFKWLEELFSRF